MDNRSIHPSGSGVLAAEPCAQPASLPPALPESQQPESLLPSAADLVAVPVDQADGATREAAEDYGEPWRVAPDPTVPSAACVLNRHDLMVHDPQGSDLIEDDDEHYMRRIAVCVNVCAGFSTADLGRYGFIPMGIAALSRIEPSQFDPDACESFVTMLRELCSRFGVETGGAQ